MKIAKKFKKNTHVIKIIVNFRSQKLAQTYYQCLESIITTHLNCSFLLTLALKTRTSVMALLNLA
jgi:hypothetical protein